MKSFLENQFSKPCSIRCLILKRLECLEILGLRWGSVLARFGDRFELGVGDDWLVRGNG